MIESIIPNTLSKINGKSYLLFVKIIEKYFASMTKGRLIIRDPKRDLQLSFGNGGAIEAVIQVNSADFYRRLVLGGDIGLAETYMEGIWDTQSIDDVVKWFILNLKKSPTMSGSTVSVNPIVNIMELGNKATHFARSNSKVGSQKNIHSHYDLGNKFFELFLDETMTYSSGIFENTDDLVEAQQVKFRKLAESGRMKNGLEVLEIGTGWGEFSCYLAEHYDCKITTVTISKEQFEYASKKVKERKLDGKIQVLYRDYRDITGQYDRIFTVEMLEAVGDRFLPVFFRKANALLRENGIMAHQIILCGDTRYENLKTSIDFIQKHIFPGSLLPSIGRIMECLNGVDEYMMLDYFDFGKDYWRTLKIWQETFNSKKSEIKTLGFNDSFVRKWNYYFSYCASAFLMRNITVGHLAITRLNNFDLN